jgi:hypothetical protein
MLEPWAEVIWVQEAANVTTVCATEAAVTLESVMTFIREAKAWATLAEREAQKRVSRMEAESVAALASAHGEAEGFAWRIALMEGELTEAR